MAALSPKTRRRAFTLVEVLLALALATVVLSALQSLIMISGRAIPDADGVQASAVGASNALERLTTEVSVAVEVLEVTSTSITFSVNDWTGDDKVETIKYAWSGFAGDPLLRAVNGGLAGVLVDSVQSFSLTAETSSLDVDIGGTEAKLEGATVQSMDVLNIIPDEVSRTKAYAQRIVPDLPAYTVEWEVKDVSIWVRSGDDSEGKLIVELRHFDTATGLPGTTVFKKKEYETKSLTNSLTRIDLSFDSPKFGPRENLCIVVRAEETGVSCVLVTGPPLTTPGSRSGLTSSDGGSTWSKTLNWAIRNEVTADIWTDTGREGTRITLDALQSTLATGSPLTTVTRTVRPFSTPEVLP